LLRVHIVKDGFVVGVMGFDGTTAWTESPGRLPVAAVGREAEMLTNWSRFDDPLVGYSERGAEVRFRHVWVWAVYRHAGVMSGSYGSTRTWFTVSAAHEEARVSLEVTGL
jgi:hypothetical protein